MTLSDRIAALPEPTREAFLEAWDAVFPNPQSHLPGSEWTADFKAWRNDKARFEVMLGIGAWTSAAEMFLPYGWLITEMTDCGDKSGCSCAIEGIFNDHKYENDCGSRHRSLALLSACLKARGL